MCGFLATFFRSLELNVTIVQLYRVERGELHPYFVPAESLLGSA